MQRDIVVVAASAGGVESRRGKVVPAEDSRTVEHGHVYAALEAGTRVMAVVLSGTLKSSEEGGRRLSHQYLQEEAARTREALGTIRVLQSRVGRGDDSLLTP